MKNPKTYCTCDTNLCPKEKVKECSSCCDGDERNGGKKRNRNGICEHYCLESKGFTFCGDGLKYQKGLNCTNCRITDTGNFSIY